MTRLIKRLLTQKKAGGVASNLAGVKSAAKWGTAIVAGAAAATTAVAGLAYCNVILC